MKLKLPAMVDRPESRAVVGGLTYWLFAFLVFPFMVLLIVSGPDISSQYAWIDIAYHGINFLVTLVIFLPYLRESAFMARFDTALNAGCMLNGYRPVTLEELVENNRRFRQEDSAPEALNGG